MKVTLFEENGGPEVLQYAEYPKPEIGRDQVLVEIKAVALNHLDLFVRNGIPGLELPLPHILGSDISGVIVEVGKGVPQDLRVEDGAKGLFD